MTLPRKAFLRGATLGALGVAALRASDAEKRFALPAFAPGDEESYWRAVRDLYPLSPDLAYLNTGGLGPTSNPALRVVEQTMRALQQRSEHGHARFAEARAAAARFLGAEPSEVAFVRNATEGNAIVASGLALKSGDEVIFETHAHPGGSFPWLNQTRLRGVVVKLFEPDPRDPAENVKRVAALLTSRTRVVQVSHITAPTGILLPVPELARLCRERGIWFHVDGAQSAGMVPLAMRALGCDSFATSGHKWLGAPHETGLLFVRKERIAEVEPTQVGAYSGDVERLPGELKLHTSAERFEYGTRNVALALGLAEAIRLQEEIGRERIAQRVRWLTARVHAGLSAIRGVEVLTSNDAAVATGMLAFRTAAVPFEPLFGRLLREHALRCRPVSEQGLNALRVSTHVFNSPAECDRLVSAVEKIVGTP